MTARPPFYLTTAISYPNGAPHIGHAYELIASDAIARFHRLDGRDVFFTTGTDEHGLKMMQTAEREGLSVRALADRNVQLFQALVPALNCEVDRFIRTTDADHYEASQALWTRMVEAGDIYLSKYAGWYSVRDEAYYAESETQLDAAGVRVGGQGTPVEWTEEESYFFRLSAYGDRLLALYDQNPEFISPATRRNEVVSFVRSGLEDLSISRTTFNWGVPVPGDERHVMYVWVDALTNYLTSAGFPEDPKRWPADLHIIGKDIVRFHAVYWPAFLLSAGLDLPRKVFGHGFLLNRGQKMSKSVGNVVDPIEMAKLYGADALRYFLLREVPFGQDGSYDHDAIVRRINADLANDLGNLAQRSLSMVARHFAGAMPERGPLTGEEAALLERARALPNTCRAAMAELKLHVVLAEIFAVVAEANRNFAASAPWTLKGDLARMGTVLAVTLDVVRRAAVLCQPAMPVACGRLLDLLGVAADERDFSALEGEGGVAAGTSLPAPAAVFPRFVDDAAPSAA